MEICVALNSNFLPTFQIIFRYPNLVAYHSLAFDISRYDLFFKNLYIHLLSLQRLIDEEKLDSFDVPYYSPTPEEVKKVIEQEESFALELIESFPTEPREIYGDGAEPMRKYANVIRAYTEPVISNQFGAQVLDELYNKFASFMVRDLSKDTEPYKVVTVVIVLRKM